MGDENAATVAVPKTAATKTAATKTAATKTAATKTAASRAKSQVQAQRDAQKRRAVVTWMVAGVVAVGLVGALVAFIVRQGDVTKVGGAGQLGLAVASENGGIPVGSGGVVGDELDATRVRMDVYFDFMCPACGAFEQTQGATVDSLREQGLVDVYYHPLGYLDVYSQGTEYSTRAASAAALVAAESPGDFLAFVEAMFANQPAENSKGLSDEQIQSLASAAGVPDAVVARIPDHEYAAWVRSASEAASKAGVMYTPTLGFNGEIQDPSNPASVQWSQEGALRNAIVTRSNG